MILARIGRKAIAFIYFLFKLRSFKVAYLFAHYHVDLNAAHFLKVKGGDLVFSATGNLICIKSLRLFKLGFPFLLRVLNSKEVHVKSSDSDGIILVVNTIVMKVKDHTGIATIQEVFVENLYKFHLPFDRSVILDIGMNTGYASLFFASINQVDCVYSFEPFVGTYNEALNNFQLNPHLKEKIIPYCYGISNSTEKIIVPLLEAGSTIGSTNKNFIESSIFQSNVKANIEVEIRSIDTILKQIEEEHPNTPIILKIDCEGEEYNIIDQINHVNQWGNIQMILMEWHIKGPDILLSILSNNNFTCIDLPRIMDTGLNECKTGMIYAIKN